MPILTAEERLGSKLANKYRIDRILGEGGMGVVFEAVDLRFDRKVAIKFLHAQYARDAEVVRRFTNEAKAAAKLPGDHVVAVQDVDIDATDGSPYIVLEFLDGEPLTKRLDRGTLTPNEAWRILGPLMEVLEMAHQRGIVHRDLKPDNIYLSHNWKGVLVPKVLDFGVAKLLEGSSAGKTSTGTLVGTPTYMSPEQATGRDVGPWSDVWSMGVIWFEALSGRMHHDFDAEGPLTAVILAIVHEQPKQLFEVAPSVDPAIASVIDRALAVKRADRFATMEEFRRAMASAVEGRASAVPGASLDGPTVPEGKNPIGLAATLPGLGTREPSQRIVPPPSTSDMGASTPIGTVPGLAKRSLVPYYVGAAALVLVTLAGVAWMFGGGGTTDAVPVAAVAPPPIAVGTAPPTTAAQATVSVAVTPSEPPTSAAVPMGLDAQEAAEHTTIDHARHVRATTPSRASHTPVATTRPATATATATAPAPAPAAATPAPTPDRARPDLRIHLSGDDL